MMTHVDVYVDSEMEQATVFDHGGTMTVEYEVDDPEVVQEIEDNIEAILAEVSDADQ